MKKLFYFTLATLILVFASCGMNKNSVSSGYLKSDKLLASQQLSTELLKHDEMIPINFPDCKEIVQASSYDIPCNTVKFQSKGIIRRVNPIAITKKIQSSGKNLATLASFPEKIGFMRQIIQKPAHLTSIKSSQLSNTISLILWIALLILSVVFFFLINVFGELTFLGVLFNVLAILALVGFLVFFILWITSIYKKKHHII